MLKFPDISFYQDSNETPAGVDFAEMRTQTPAVIIRAGQNLWVDQDFLTNWQAAKAAGLAHGSYWFYDSRANPALQAQKWIEALGSDLGELPLCADFEERYGGAFEGWRYWYDFLNELKKLAIGKEILIYTGYYYWIENTSQLTPAQMFFFKQFPLWIAAYNPVSPQIPPPWKDWTFWQYTEKGDGPLYGVESKNIDLNYFNGNNQAFVERFNLEDGGVTPPDPEEPMYKFEMMDINSNEDRALRAGPNVTFPRVTNTGLPMSVVRDGYVVRGIKMFGDEMVTLAEDVIDAGKVVGMKGDQWLKVKTIAEYVSNNDYFGYVAYKHMGVVVCDLKTNDVTPEPPTPGKTLVHTIKTYSDGSITIDDIPYPAP